MYLIIRIIALGFAGPLCGQQMRLDPISSLQNSVTLHMLSGDTSATPRRGFEVIYTAYHNGEPYGYRKPLIFQYIYHIQLTTFRPCIQLKNLPQLQTIILLGHF